jgi:hypothetical protein
MPISGCCAFLVLKDDKAQIKGMVELRKTRANQYEVLVDEWVYEPVA